MHLAALLLLTLAAPPDGGGFEASSLGHVRAGENVAALDERWVQGLAEPPLLARVERKRDDLAVAFYAQTKPAADGGAPEFKEVARFPIPQTRLLDGEQVQSLGAAGQVLAITTHADDPDDEPVALTLIGKGPKLLLQASFLRDAPATEPVLELGPPEGFSLEADGGARVEELSRTKRVPVARPDGGAGLVTLGQHEKTYLWQDGRFQPGPDRYRDFLAPLKLQAPGFARLVDGKPKTSERLRAGTTLRAELPPGAQVRMVRLVPGCLESPSRAAHERPARAFAVRLDDTAPIEVEVGMPVEDPRLFGAGEFTLGEGYGTSEMLFFAQPVPARTLTVTVKGQGGCLAELAAY